MSYFDGTDEGYAIEVEQVHEFDTPIDPEQVVDDFSPPVSFYYIQDDSEFDMARELPKAMSETDSPDPLQYSSD